MHANERLIRAQVERFIAGDIAGWLALCTSDLLVHVPAGHQLSGTYEGAQTFVEKFIGKVMALTGGVQVEPHDFFASDDRGVGIYTIRTQRNGVKYEWRHVNLYQFRNGKIAEIWWTPVDQAKVAALFT